MAISTKVPRPYVGADRAAPQGVQGGSFTADRPRASTGRRDPSWCS